MFFIFQKNNHEIGDPSPAGALLAPGRRSIPILPVYALKLAATAHPSPISDWSYNGPKNDSVIINFMIWLIRGSNGKNFLFDAGFAPGLTAEKEFEIVNYARPDFVLLKLGLKAGDITDIIVSHPHWDHLMG